MFIFTEKPVQQWWKMRKDRWGKNFNKEGVKTPFSDTTGFTGFQIPASLSKNHSANGPVAALGFTFNVPLKKMA